MPADPRTHRAQVRSASLRTALAVAFAVLTALAVVAPEWVESGTGAAPDGGSGALEWILALTAGVATALASVGAGVAWRRAAAVV